MNELASENEVERKRLETDTSNKVKEVEALRQKKADHLKYFFAHIMKKLKMSGDEFKGQLESKLNNLSSERDQEVSRLKTERDEELERVEKQKQKKQDHLK